MRKLRIVVCEPSKEPEVKVINNSLKAMQEVVGGYIEVFPFPIGDDHIRLVCNEEGKLNYSEAVLMIGDEVICGTAFFVGEKGDSFVSLTDMDIRTIGHFLW